MDLDWLNLESGEDVLWSGEPKINSIYSAIALGILLIPFFGIGLVIIAGAYLHLKNTSFVITDKGLYKKTGILSTNVKRIKFDRVQNTAYRKTFFGNVFGYGNLDISTAGGSGVEMRFNAVEDPRNIQDIINERVEDEERDVSDKDILNKILEELRDINSKL